MHPGEAVGGFADIDMTWLLHCAVAVTGWKLTSTRTVLWQQQESRVAKNSNTCERLVGATVHIVGTLKSGLHAITSCSEFHHMDFRHH